MSRFHFFNRTSLLLVALSPLHAQTAPVALQPIGSIPFDSSGPVLRQAANPSRPFTVAGPRGVLVGQQDGVFESWVLPVKLLSHFTIEADVEGYGVPIDVNQQAAHIEVRPDRTILTYAHATFTVRQIMFSPDSNPSPDAPSLSFAAANARAGNQPPRPLAPPSPAPSSSSSSIA